MNTLEIETPAARFRRCLPPQLRDCGEHERLRDLALDSIDTVDLLCAVHEEFGVRFADEDFTPDLTVRELIHKLAQS